MKTGHMIVMVAVIALVVGLTIGYMLGSSSTSTNRMSISSVGNETFVTFHTTLSACTGCNNFGTTFVYPISINYNNSWILHYWIENYTGTENTISGNLVGSGNSETWITFYGYGEYTLCASATRLPSNDTQLFNPILTLTVIAQNESTTASNPTIEVCGTMAV